MYVWELGECLMDTCMLCERLHPWWMTACLMDMCVLGS